MPRCPGRRLPLPEASKIFTFLCRTPRSFDDLLLCGDTRFLTGIRFTRGEPAPAEAPPADGAGPEWLSAAVRWLDLYFQGKQPDFLPPYRLRGLTPFQDKVLKRLLLIPRGTAVTYGELARELAALSPGGRMSARAVGQAAHKNPLCILIPCHRVLGAGGKLTGYGGGIENKKALLRLEGIPYKE